MALADVRIFEKNTRLRRKYVETSNIFSPTVEIHKLKWDFRDMDFETDVITVALTQYCWNGKQKLPNIRKISR